MTRPACQMPAWALALAWKQMKCDRRDADLFRVFAGLKDCTTPHARMMLLSGLAGFRR